MNWLTSEGRQLKVKVKVATRSNSRGIRIEAWASIITKFSFTSVRKNELVSRAGLLLSCSGPSRRGKCDQSLNTALLFGLHIVVT